MTRIIDADELEFTTIWNDDGTAYAEYVLKDDILKARKYRPEVILIDQPITRVLVQGEDYTKVVRCKDCKMVDITGWCNVIKGYVHDGFCAWGERKEE